jgi:hypothetical protein
MTKYEVILKLSYYEYAFRFDTLEEAGNFAKTSLTSYRSSGDKSNIERELDVSIRLVTGGVDKDGAGDKDSEERGQEDC